MTAASVVYLEDYRRPSVSPKDDNQKALDEQMFFLLGELKSDIRAIHDDIQDIRAEVAIDRQDTKENRRRIYETIASTDRRIVNAESTLNVVGQMVEKLTTRIDVMEPTVDKTSAIVKRWVMIGAGISAVMSGLAWTTWYLLKDQWWPIYQYVINVLPR